MTTAPPVLDVVVPVHNEQVALGPCVERLVAHLRRTFPYPFGVTIADNASTDATWALATALVDRFPEVRAVHLEEKGRGRALAVAWSSSEATVLAYMDVDLSTDLDAVHPLVAPLLVGHCDLAIGSRLAPGARVVRGPKRELISRSYNLLLRTTLGARYSDAQCGFKAIRREVAEELLPLVEDTSWFFDTELLTLAERCGLRIHEVPVDWYDDPDSRVGLLRTAVDDLRGIVRLRRALTAGRLPLDAVATRVGRPVPRAGLTSQAWRFAGVGVVSTFVHLGLFAALLGILRSALTANFVALLVATGLNTAANRRWTFGVRGRRHLARHQAQALAVFAVTWGLTSLGLLVLHRLAPGAATVAQTTALAVATAVSTALRFVALRSWVFRPPPVPVKATPVRDDLGPSPVGTRRAEGGRFPRSGHHP